MSTTAHSATAVAAPPRLGDPYQPRPVRFIRLEREATGGSRSTASPRPAGRRGRSSSPPRWSIAPAVLPAPAIGDERYGVGIVLVHDSATYCFALYYWWQSANELHQRVYAAPREDPRALAKLADPGAGCVWELAVVDFERRAWLEDVLANPGGPDIDRYLTRRFSAEV